MLGCKGLRDIQWKLLNKYLKLQLKHQIIVFFIRLLYFYSSASQIIFLFIYSDDKTNFLIFQ